MRSPSRRPMKSLATALVAVSRSTRRLPSSKSFASILPDRSTASIRLRPDTGTSSSSPMRSGRAAARTSSAHATTATQNRQLNSCSTSERSASIEKPLKLGTRRPASWVPTTGGSNARTSKGSGSASSIQGQASDHIRLRPPATGFSGAALLRRSAPPGPHRPGYSPDADRGATRCAGRSLR